MSNSAKKPNILCVDDEKSILDALRRVFRTSNCNVFVANGGKQGLEIMAENTIDLVISDMRMPEMTGAEFLEQVAKEYEDTVRILLTGYSDIKSTIAAVNKGRINNYVSKPWDNDYLKKIVDGALYTKRLEDEHAELLALTKEQNEQLQELNNNLEEQVNKRTKALKLMLAKVNQGNKDLKHSYRSFVKVFSHLIELRENKKEAHTGRVANHVKLIAEGMDIEEENIEQLYYAALLRNIGKVTLSDTAMTSPFEVMTDEDKKAYKKHPATGEALLMSVGALNQAANIIRSHRERVDGKGFPDGLDTENIPLESKILAIASDYDDMLHGMYAQKKINSEKAIAYFKEQVGKRYDADVVKTYLDVLETIEHLSIAKKEKKLSVKELRDGMILARDLITPDGILLLSQDMALNERIINKVKRFEKDVEEGFYVFINIEAPPS